MKLTAVFLVGSFLPFGPILAGRWLDQRSWRASLVTYELRWPATLDVAQAIQWLTTVGAITNPPRWSVFAQSPLCLELVATSSGIAFYLHISSRNRAAQLHGLRAAVPGIRVTANAAAPADSYRTGLEARLTNRVRPLATDRLAGMSAAFLESLQPVPSGAEIRIQWIVTSAGTPPRVPTATGGKDDRWWTTYALDGELPGDAEAVRALRLKRQDALLRGVLRVGVGASTHSQARLLLGQVWPNLHHANAPGVRVVRRWLPNAVVTRQLSHRSYPLLRWPLLVNAREAAGLMGLPLGGVVLPGLNPSTAQQLPPHPSMPRRGAVIGVSNYAGTVGRPLALTRADRLRHTWITAPTGGGKSTLMARLALQDIQDGHGVVVIDPKNDLVADILDRFPRNRLDDVIVMDPASLDRPIGLNILRAATGEHQRELVVDNVQHIFGAVWKSSWGPRTGDVIRNALLTLTHTQAADGSAFTLCEVPELLLNPMFRRWVNSQPTVPSTVRQFWAWYESLTERERTAVIGPSLNKLRQLTTRTALRLILGQSKGIDLGAVFRERKVLLVALSKGTVGTDTAQLIGALIFALLWQSCLTRMSIPRARRRTVFLYADEFSDIVKLPVPHADVLSQARGLGLAATLATQYVAQLPDDVRAAVLGTVRTQIAFQLDYDDARLLATRFAPLTADDLAGLEEHEVAIRPTVHGRVLRPVTGTTLPLDAPVRDGQAVAAAARRRHGMRRSAIETGLRSRLTAGAIEGGLLGRREARL